MSSSQMQAGSDISELLSAHRGLVSDRITERKKSATLLRDLLDSNHIIDFITTSSSSGQTTRGKSRSQPLTWSSLFRNVVGYILKEAEAVAKTEENSKGARSSSALQTKKKDMSDMLRIYLRAANKRGPHVCVGEVVEHILTVLRNPRMIVWMCAEYSHILLHYILQKSHYVVQISATAWNELIVLYGSLYLSPPSSSCDHTLLSRVLLSLVSLSSTQCDMDPATLYAFFSKAMPNIAKEKSPKILENLLLSFVTYCTATSHNSRGRLCSLGEALFADILHLWGHCQTPVGVQIVSLLRFQMRIHHPCGRHDDASGGWAANDTQWKKNLENLYDLILADFDNASHKLQWSGKGELGLKPALIDLACDVINQMMYIRKERAAPDNQAHISSSIQPREKRLRLQTCWGRLRDGLSTNSDSPSLIIWLQLISWLVAKWRDCLSPDDTPPLLTELVRLLTENKRPECVPWILTCLHVLAVTPLGAPPHDLWGKVWTATIKSVSVCNTEEEGLALLTALVEQHHLESDREPWQLLSQVVNSNCPRRPLVMFIATLIRHHRLPEALGHHHRTSPLPTLPTLTTSTPSPQHNTHCMYPLRVQLLHFLVPTDCHEAGEGSEGGRVGGGEGGGVGHNLHSSATLGNIASGMASLRPDISLCAHTLVALTQRSCSALQQNHIMPQTSISIRDKVCGLLGLQDSSVEQSWQEAEQLYLESTFDTPVRGQGAAVQVEPINVYPKESPIPCLLLLLLELLGNGAEKLLKPITLEATTSVRDKVHHLVVAMETQAYHCALTIHVLFLVGVVSGRSLTETMRKSPAIKLLPSLLQKVSAGLRDALWNEVERSEYNQAVTTTLYTLTPLFLLHESEGQRKLSSECSVGVQLAREAVFDSFPRDFLSICLKIALKKSSLPPQPSSRPSSTFSVTTSTSASSHRASLTSSPLSLSSPSSLPQSSPFDDDMDIGTSHDTALTTQTDTLSPTEQATCRMEAAAFIVHWYQLTTAVPRRGVVGDHNGTPPTRTDVTFDTEKALLSMLSDESIHISKPADVQIVFHICGVIASCDKVTSNFLEAIMEVVSQVLTQHRKSQSVLYQSLKLLEQLARHYSGEGGSREASSVTTVSHVKTILSAFWSLYVDNALSASVRIQLASTLCAYLSVAMEDGADSLVLCPRKRKKSDSSPEGVTIHEALLQMINDTDHAVRMHMAKVVTFLHCVAGGGDVLVSREEQLQIFQKVSDMLKKANLISTDQDELSVEDESVNCVSSMITTLQYQACVSPVCEAAVLAELATAAGHGYIDQELISKALIQVSRFLGYTTMCGFLDDHFLSMLAEWLDKEQSLDSFPHQLFGDSSQAEFFRDRADVIAPLLVYRCDEASLLTLSSLLPSSSSSSPNSLPSLLSESLPSSMALILPSFAQRDSHDSESTSEQRITKAHASHDLLTKHLSEEEIAESIKTKMADFVIHLLLRLFEPLTASSHLARYSKLCDPEPVPPHFSSLAVRATLDYIATCYGSGSTASSAGHPFMKQLARRKDNIEKVLLSLAVAMETTHRPFIRRRLLQSYALFVSFISDQLAGGLEGATPFVVMDIIHTVIRLLNHEKERPAAARGRAEGRRVQSEGRTGEVGEGGGGEGEREQGDLEEKTASLCLHALTTLIRSALESCPEQLGRHLQVVVATLVTFTQWSTPGNNMGKQALQLLRLLLTPPHPPTLTPHLSQLDPLPSTDVGDMFHKFRDHLQRLREAADQLSLEQEMNRFIEAGTSLPLSTRAPGLRRLTDMIRARRGDVIESLRGENSSVLRLIQVLVGVASETTPTVVMEMGRFLGELGGLDLHCIALPSTPINGSFDHTSLPNGWSPQSCYTAHLLFLLTSLLKDDNILVVQASHACLHGVLATKSAATVLSKMEDIYDWTSYLQSFKPHKKGSATSQTPVAPPTNHISMDTPSLWIPQPRHGNTSDNDVHKHWITRLVTGLLESGGVSDQVLLLVKPVCLVKVSFCESVFPYLILDLLWNQEGLYRPIISQHFQTFFSVAATGPSPSSPSPTSSQASLHRVPLSPSSPLSPPPSASTRIMLNTIMFLRTVNRPKLKKGTLWDNNFWLDLDFLDVAMAAQRCSAYFTSLLYIEIWHGVKCDALWQSDDSMVGGADEDNMVAMETTTGLMGSAGLEDPRIQQLLLEAYGTNIGDPDSLYGVCTSKTVSKETWMRLYEQEGEWEKSLSAYNLQMHLPSPRCQANLVGSLQSLGLTHVLNMYLTGVGVASPQSMQSLSRFQYEAAWRCSIWEDQNINTLTQPGSYVGYHRHLCDSLLALRDGESGLLASSISAARMEVLGSLCAGGQEGCGRIYRSLSQLHCLCELEEAGGEGRNSPATSPHLLPFLMSWQDRLKHLDADFSYIEPVLSLRASTLHSQILRERGGGGGGGGRESSVMDMAGKRRVEQLFVALSDTLLTLAKTAQDVGSYQIAEGALFSLHHLDSSRASYSVPASLYPSLSWKHQLQEARLHWGRGESNLALGQLRGLLQRMKALPDPPPEVSSLYPPALCLYGSWLGHTHSENPAIIMEKYLEQSVALMEEQQTSDLGPILQAYLMLARFADSQYQRVTRHMMSAAYESKRQLLQKSKMELSRLTETMSTEARARNRHVRTLTAQIEEDEVAMTGLVEDKQQFLEKALHNYIHCLRTGDEHDLRIFRLCSLWFANSTDTRVNTIITEGAAQLESRKFLPLLYQLAARMSARNLATDPFQHTLQEIIFRASVDHPYHSLYVTLALSHASMDDMFPATGHVTGNKVTPRGSGRLGKKSMSTTTKNTVDEDKVKAARDLIHRLHSEKPSLVHAMEQLCEAYIDLAYHDVSTHRKERKPIKFPASCTLIKLAGQLKDVAVPTVDIEVDPSCNYSHLVTIDRFDTHFQLAGGINLPKILSCMGSDGKRRRQLVKGKDDLRQDAVMQQVFVLVNKLLQKEHSTLKRKLNIRTYNVIPLSQRSGIVEWCEGTTPLGEYLIGPQKYPQQGVHSRYRPQDWPSIECRKKLMDAGSKKGLSKVEIYAAITRHFCPVFHHFFMEKFLCPSEWFERRLMYTRSVATSSIVGYVVGLGDRHVQNILIDTNTAEFIHIDLGVAFEQGRTLPTPETVPFRLTRDIVDGMGVAGVEGVFRRCCEKTMEVMRASHEELRTIVEVLLYDPLYMWTISPVKALNLQRRGTHGDDSNTTGAGGQIFEGDGPPMAMGNESNPTNKMAERVLLRLQEKLEGIEDGIPLSVSGQVNQLIQEATDPSNLCLLFPGWQAWI